MPPLHYCMAPTASLLKIACTACPWDELCAASCVFGGGFRVCWALYPPTCHIIRTKASAMANTNTNAQNDANSRSIGQERGLRTVSWNERQIVKSSEATWGTWHPGYPA